MRLLVDLRSILFIPHIFTCHVIVYKSLLVLLSMFYIHRQVRDMFTTFYYISVACHLVFNQAIVQ